MPDDGTTDDDSEGRLERRIFRELFASWPSSEHIETGMFPTLFPLGQGVFDQDRPRQPRFVEYRDHLLRQADPRFRQNAEWRQWADTVAEAIELRRRGEDVSMPVPSQEETSAAMDEFLRTKTLEEKLADPLKIRNALLAMGQMNPLYREEQQGQNIDFLVEERIAEQRRSDWSAIKECGLCHRYECPENAGLKLSRCSKCKHVYYCCREHQTEDWPNHRKRCKKVAEAMSSST